MHTPFTAGLLSTFLLLTSSLYAQNFSLPIPIGSQQSSKSGFPATHVDATHLKFFKHPEAPRGSENFVSEDVTIDGRRFLVDDVVATPGIFEGMTQVNAGNAMLDGLGNRLGLPLNPLHGFCPERLVIQGATSNRLELTLDCQIADGSTSRELQVADVRMFNALASPSEFERLFGTTEPLVAAVMGSAEQTLTPYGTDLYPATIQSAIFSWPFLGPTQAYQDVVAYDLADVGQGIITAAYDPVKLLMNMQAELSVRTATQNLQVRGQLPQQELPFLSPLAFFRKDDYPSRGRMRLAGYSSLQFPSVLNRENAATLLAQNFNPIAVQPMKFTKSATGTGAPQPDEGFAVVNQATLLNLDDILMYDGLPYVDPTDHRAHSWAEYLGTRDASGQFQPLDATTMPHRTLAYTIFWRRHAEWASRPTVESYNPNAVFGPFVFALVGPGVFDADVIVDQPITTSGATTSSPSVESLIVPSGEVAADGKTYVYKIEPINADRLWWRFNPKTPVAAGLPGVQTPFVLPTAYAIESPAGFVPYHVKSFDVDRDGCGDIALTFRGSETTPLRTSRAFQNNVGDHVVFQVSSSDPRMFASVVQIHRGKFRNGRCEIEATAAERFIPHPGAQIAAIAIEDIDGNGTKDLLVGDLMPRKIPEGERGAGEYTGYAYLYADASPLSVPKWIRVGFKTSNHEITDLRAVLDGSDADGVLGVASLDVTFEAGQGANIASINGAPLALPAMGCPSSQNAEVASFPEIAWSVMQGVQSAQKGLTPFFPGATGFIPQRCAHLNACAINNASLAVNGWNLPFWENEPCCNPCGGTSPLATWQHNQCRDILCGNWSILNPTATLAPYPELCEAMDISCRGLTGVWPVVTGTTMCQLSGASFLPANHACCNADPCNQACQQYLDEENRCLAGSSQHDQHQGICSSSIRRGCRVSSRDEIKEETWAYQPDRIVDPRERGHAITSMSELKPAATGYVNQNSLKPPLGSSFILGTQNEDIAVIAQNVETEIGRVLNLKEPQTFEEFVLSQMRGFYSVLFGGSLASGGTPLQLQSGKTGSPITSGTFPPTHSLAAAATPPTSPGLAPIRLARGTVMPGPREMTVMINTTRPDDWACSPTGPVAAGFECNADYDNCGPRGGVCGIDCRCHRDCGNGPLETGEQCNRDNPCEAGQICTIGCQCVGGIEPPKPQPAIAENITCRVNGFSSEKAKKRFEALNQEFRTVSGLAGDIIGEPEFSIIECVTCVPDASAPEIPSTDIGLSLSGTPLPSVGGNIRPWAVVQTHGAMLTDFTKSIYQPQSLSLVHEPMRILPLENRTAGRPSIVLPSLSNSSRIRLNVPLSASTEVSMVEDERVVRLNNVFQHSMQAMRPGTIFSIGTLSLALPSKAMATTGTTTLRAAEPEKTAYACHAISMRLQPDIASWTGVESGPISPKNIEEREFDWEKLKAAIAARRAAKELVGQKLTSADLVDLPWEENMRNEFMLVQDRYGKASEPVPPSSERVMVVLAGYPQFTGQGAGCSCRLTEETPRPQLLELLMILGMTPITVLWRFRQKKTISSSL
ncbi:MAG: hypothetical protein HY540_03140 [Deltaproteobacteria bacterium]|nr:hypothetical protein [Deltaproteobacteria bacterium]